MLNLLPETVEWNVYHSSLRVKLTVVKVLLSKHSKRYQLSLPYIVELSIYGRGFLEYTKTIILAQWNLDQLHAYWGDCSERRIVQQGSGRTCLLRTHIICTDYLFNTSQSKHVNVLPRIADPGLTAHLLVQLSINRPFHGTRFRFWFHPTVGFVLFIQSVVFFQYLFEQK